MKKTLDSNPSYCPNCKYSMCDFIGNTKYCAICNEYFDKDEIIVVKEQKVKEYF